MLKSMTAYGRATFHSAIGHFTAEIQSVNRKFLEIHLQLPKELIRFEAELRKELSRHLARGQVTLRIYASFENKIPIEVRPNLPLARQLKNAWETIAKELGLPATNFDLSLLSKEDELIIFDENLHDEEAYKEALLAVLMLALDGFIEMKVKEGAALQDDIASRINKTKKLLEMIQAKAAAAPIRYYEKIKARLEELLPAHPENTERLLREVALLAEKLDITEEITRFLYHLKHADEMLTLKEGIGKPFEFLLQEMNREVNTIGSKSSEIEISRHVIDIKSELEKIREQIQNVE